MGYVPFTTLVYGFGNKKDYPGREDRLYATTLG